MTPSRETPLPDHELKLLEFYSQKRLDRKAVLERWIEKRLSGVPLQHLTGFQNFWGREFVVSPSVLIPRPETEGLVEWALEWVRARGAQQPSSDFSPTPLRVLDWGTGSGAIAVTLQAEVPSLSVVGCDCSPAALAIAQLNASRLAPKTLFFSTPPSLEASLAESFSSESCRQWDLVVSNPPYLLEGIDEVAWDVSTYEPGLALWAPKLAPHPGESLAAGLGIYVLLARALRACLKPHGAGLFELPHERAEAIGATLQQEGFDIALRQDLTGRKRYVLIKPRIKNG